jgi:hypothetical protein
MASEKVTVVTDPCGRRPQVYRTRRDGCDSITRRGGRSAGKYLVKYLEDPACTEVHTDWGSVTEVEVQD